MSTRKLAYFYLPILAILLILVATSLDYYYGRPIRVLGVVFVGFMGLLLIVGIRNKVWRD